VKLVPLAGRPDDAVRLALLSHGWEGDLSRSTAGGLEPLAFELTEAPTATLEALVATSSRLGLELVTGNDWALLAGSRARLAAFARPWNVPEPLGELAAALGRALPGEDPVLWQTARGPLVLERPSLVGIINLTPDSFSDGGLLTSTEAVLHRAERLLADGADILDMGGESTRPGADPVSEPEERERVIPALAALAKSFPHAILSVDTTKGSVARAALEAGAAIVNDVSGFRLDPAMAAVCAEGGAGVVLMHSRGGAGSLASLEHAGYRDGVLVEVADELAAALESARRAGIGADRIVLDPGLGFGKTPEQAIELLRGLGNLRLLGRPVLVGPSRKRFLGALTGRPPAERDVATAACCALAWHAGARLFRVHDVASARDALALAAALRPR
jgi:dihydropteroate synthase